MLAFPSDARAVPAPHAAPRDVAPVGAAPPAPSADELSDDDLEAVVGGLARTWTDALRQSARRPL